MKKKAGKILIWMIEISLFCGYFYVLFVNLVCGFSMGCAGEKWDIIKIVCISVFLAAGFPGIIWYQHRKILKLMDMLSEHK